MLIDLLLALGAFSAPFVMVVWLEWLEKKVFLRRYPESTDNDLCPIQPFCEVCDRAKRMNVCEHCLTPEPRQDELRRRLKARRR